MTSSSPRNYQIVLIGASRGGTDAVRNLLSGLGDDFLLPIVVVIHRGKESDGGLARLLQKSTPLPVLEAEDKMEIASGHVYVAPANYHLLIDCETNSQPLPVDPKDDAQSYCSWNQQPSFALTNDEPVHFARPSVDVLFETAAQVFKSGAIGIILTGGGEDGSAGLNAVAGQGGLTIVQSPNTAHDPSMPAAAGQFSEHVLPLPHIPKLLKQFGSSRSEEQPTVNLKAD